jgi:hypothetical protein
MRKILWALLLIVPGVAGLVLPAGTSGQSKNLGQISFKKDVQPVLGKYCLPCHAEESYNRSELSLDSFELLMKGGRHGAGVVPGKPTESLLMAKLSDTPPFGESMPVKPRRLKPNEAPKKLSIEEVKLLKDWIAQGAKNN